VEYIGRRLLISVAIGIILISVQEEWTLSMKWVKPALCACAEPSSFVKNYK